MIFTNKNDLTLSNILPLWGEREMLELFPWLPVPCLPCSWACTAPHKWKWWPGSLPLTSPGGTSEHTGHSLCRWSGADDGDGDDFDGDENGNEVGGGYKNEANVSVSSMSHSKLWW